jgi:hypothetical protein
MLKPKLNLTQDMTLYKDMKYERKNVGVDYKMSFVKLPS